MLFRSEQYPYADIYSGRIEPDKPGTIIIKGNGTDQRFVIALLGQYYPGKSKYVDSTLDGIKAREKYFHQGLIEISKIPNLESIAIPKFVGCGAAGGNWDYYYGTIKNFADFIFKKQKAKVIIYDLYGQ